MFHVGHVNILRRAASACDKLVVGVTTDELSLARKGKVPVIPFSERCEVLRSVKYVDEVVPQDSMDKMTAWHRIGFHVMFVGDDWKGTPVWNQLERDFGEVGVEIVYFPYTSGTSSTLLRNILQEMQNGHTDRR